jgi:LytS/YehU family sensor histidine kinase
MLTAVVCVLEAAWPSWLFWSGERPELLVALIVAVGLVGGGRWGVICGFFAALWRGAVGHEAYGGLFLAFMAVGIMNGAVGHQALTRRLLAAAGATALSVIVLRIVLMIVHGGGDVGLGAAGALRASIYTAVVGIPIYLLVVWVHETSTRASANWADGRTI